MDTVSTPDALARPWRTAAVVASAVAALELLVLLAVGAVALGPSILDRLGPQASHGGHRAAAEPARTSASARRADGPAKARRERLAAPSLTRAQTAVIVLNGNGVTGAAASEAAVVKARGYRVVAVTNAPRSTYVRSVVVYRPGFKPEARRLGGDLGIRTISPLDGLRRKDLHGGHVAVVVGR